CFSTALPMSKLSSLIKFDSATKGSTNPEEFTNRPIMPDHVRTIVEYLSDRESYVLPGLTLNLRDPIRVYSYVTPSVVRGAVIVIPSSTIFYVTDGQHRVKAIEAAITQKPELANDSISVTMIVEPQIERVHQDFADCAQTKPIPPSLLTLYNRQDELSALTIEICRVVEFFHGRLEKVGKTVSKRSNNLYTVNHVRMAIGALLTGDSAANSSTLRDRATNILVSEIAYKKWRADIEWFFNELSNSIPQWRLIKEANKCGTNPPDLPEFRARYIHFTGTGLAILGGVGYHILRIDDLESRNKKIRQLSAIDWRREDEMGLPNQFWVGNVLTSDGSLGTSRSTIQAALDCVLRVVELSKPVTASV
ncbi:MAG: DNA sulfur modification protein DndB, partial [Acidobacteriales bacterium]|nr:DNA sulfur modification protein DndB [Terriglobales bacterium]